MSEMVNFMHFGNKPLPGTAHKRINGVVTVAYYRYDLEVKDGVGFKIGIAFCSPKDHFVKAKGRMIAKGRMNSRNAIQFEFVKALHKSENYTVVSIIQDCMSTGHLEVPKWMKNRRLYITDVGVGAISKARV